MKYVNEAGWDRVGRVALGVLLLALGWGEVVTGPFGTFIKFFAFVPLATGLVGWCPIYGLFGFSTRNARDGEPVAT